MKKVTAILLAFVLCFGVTIGCKKDTGTTDTGTDTAGAADEGGSTDGGTEDGGGE